ncbi:hypothetical protein FDECE_2962 [Fusarium decemcellulare]|nr:hypothetical protein FDECE_2962 [Fusarium decemcellulare]
MKYMHPLVLIFAASVLAEWPGNGPEDYRDCVSVRLHMLSRCPDAGEVKSFLCQTYTKIVDDCVPTLPEAPLAGIWQDLKGVYCAE